MKVTTDACLFGAWVAEELRMAEQEPKRILDIGAGTGLLSLMLSQVTQISKIDSVEINHNSFKEATQNYLKNPWSDRLNCYNSSIQHFKPTDQYDLIICNPPFFKNSLKGKKDHKNQAIHAEDLTMNDLINSIDNFLKDDGAFYLLYPEQEMKMFTEKALSAGIYLNRIVNVRNKKDSQIIRMMAIFTREKAQIQYQELIIKEGDNRYTAESWNLLKDYYLEYNNPLQ